MSERSFEHGSDALAVMNRNMYEISQLQQATDRLCQIFSTSEEVENEYLENGESLRFKYSEVGDTMAFIVTHRHDKRANYIAQNPEDHEQVETIYVVKNGDNNQGLHCFEYDRSAERGIEDDIASLYRNKEEYGDMFLEFVEDCRDSLRELQQRTEANVLNSNHLASSSEVKSLNRMLRPVAMRALALERAQ